MSKSQREGELACISMVRTGKSHSVVDGITMFEIAARTRVSMYLNSENNQFPLYR
jgi:hypothetical protein